MPLFAGVYVNTALLFQTSDTNLSDEQLILLIYSNPAFYVNHNTTTSQVT